MARLFQSLRRTSRVVPAIIGILLVLLVGCGGPRPVTTPTPTLPSLLQLTTFDLHLPAAALSAPIAGPLPDDTPLHAGITFKANQQILDQLNQKKVQQGQNQNLENLANQLGITDSQYQQLQAFFGIEHASLKLNKLHTNLTVDAKARSFARVFQVKFLLHTLTVLVLFSCTASAYSYISSVLHDPVPSIVNQYYTAIKNQDYATAYTYLGSHQWTSGVTSNPGRGMAGGWGFPGGQDFMTQSEFTQAAQNADTTQGKVCTFTIEDTMRPLDSSGSYTATASVSVTRNGAPYYVNLNLQQIGGGDWKIIGYDFL